MKKQSTPRISIWWMLVALLFVFAPFASWAQNATIKGVVIDNNSEPVVGATVIVMGTNNGVVTGEKGDYTISAPTTATLEFAFVGLSSKTEKINNRTRIDVRMEADNTLIDDVLVVGYGTQKRGSITGAISAVTGEQITKTKNENPINMLTGKVAGVRVWQTSAEPGTYSAKFDMRGLGEPLVIIDGAQRDLADFQRMSAEDIEDISVLKDATAAIYGLRSDKGVILVTTKKGKSGKAEVSYKGTFTFQIPSKMPMLADPYETMTIWNEKSMNKVEGGTILYGEDRFEDYRTGKSRSDDWNDLMFSNFSPQTQHDVSISGGTDKTSYYVSLGYFMQEGFFRSGDLNYNKFNLRSNITTQIAKGLKFELNVSGVADQRNTPYEDAVQIIRNYWAQGTLHPAYADAEHTMLNYEGLNLMDNAVSQMTADVSGFRKYEQKSLLSTASLTYDLGALSSALEGLSLKGMVNYDYRMDDNTIFRREYYQYAYNDETGLYDQKLYDKSSPNRNRREFYSKQKTLANIVLNYDRTFAERHKVGALIGWEVQRRKGDNFYAMRDLAYSSPYLSAGVTNGQVGAMNSGDNDLYEKAYAAIIGRVNYAYDDRYLIEAQFRYDGSSLFAPGHRWGLFPSVSVGWRVSEESFIKNSSTFSFINQLKLRASYGSQANEDNAGYGWVTGYTYPSTSGNADSGYFNQYAPGYIFNNQFIYGASPVALANRSISWMTSKMFNIGVDFEGWNGKFGFVVDYFDRRQTGMFARREGDFPSVIGAVAPLENQNSRRHLGLELTLTHRNKVGDLSYDIRAMGSIVREQYMKAYNHGPYGNSYENWRSNNLTNRYQGVQFGYEANGRFSDWNDIWNYPLYKDRDVLPGDYKYVDWNGDGEISGLDEHPYAFDQTPWLNFSFSFNAEYRNFDISMLFQGSAMGSMEYMEPLYGIWGENGGGTLEQYTDRWHPVDPKADPYDPATQWVDGYYAYSGRYPIKNSDFNRVSTAYLRLKSLELGYTLPRIQAMPSLNMRVYANAYNLFTITGVKFVDPEHPDSDLGRMYPLNRTFTLGLSLKF